MHNIYILYLNTAGTSARTTYAKLSKIWIVYFNDYQTSCQGFLLNFEL